jgi:hypothetical protein
VAKRFPGPVFITLAEYYISKNAYTNWSSEGRSVLEFQREVKTHVIEYVNESVDRHAKSLPFLKVNVPTYASERRDCALSFDRNLQNYLNERRILRVLAHKSRAGSYIVPMGSNGFEINLALGPIQRMLTSFSHEVAHTYFYDLSSSPPKSLLSDEILKVPMWQKEFEGLAYDLGREILLPKKRFEKYVRENYCEPTVSNFAKMHQELKVSRDWLSQRLLRDLLLWRGCIFWGTFSYGQSNTTVPQPDNEKIIVRPRDRRKDPLTKFSLKRELDNPKSQLRRTIVEKGRLDGIHVSYITIASDDYALGIRCKETGNNLRHFTVVLTPTNR